MKLTKKELEQRGVEYRYAYTIGYEQCRKDMAKVTAELMHSFTHTLIEIGDQKAVKKIQAWAAKEHPSSTPSDKDALAIMQYCGHGEPPAVRIVERCNNGFVVKSIHGLFLVKYDGGGGGAWAGIEPGLFLVKYDGGGAWAGIEPMSPGYVPPKGRTNEEEGRKAREAHEKRGVEDRKAKK